MNNRYTDAMNTTDMEKKGHVLLEEIGASVASDVRIAHTANHNPNHDGTLGVVTRMEDVYKAADKAANRW